MSKWNDLMAGKTSESDSQLPESSRQKQISGRAYVFGAVILAVLVLAGAAVFALTRKSDEEQVQATVEKFYEAAGTGDGRTACELLTEDALILGMDGCIRSVELDFDTANLGLGNSKVMRRVKVENVTVNGDKAFAALSPRGEVELEKENGDWRISTEPFGV